MEIDVKLLKKVRDHILEEPERLNMYILRVHKRNDTDERYDFPSCGTVGCIAWWVSVLAKPPGRGDIIDFATARLNIPDSFSELFYLDAWPDKFMQRYESARSARQRAKVTAARIDAFIKQYELVERSVQ